MPRQRSTKAAQDIVDSAQTVLSLDLVADLAAPLARHMLESYAAEEWRERPEVEALGRVAALLEARCRAVPPPVLEALRKAAEAGRPIGLA